MFNLLDIIKNDWVTYYNYSTGVKTPPIKTTVTIITAAGIFALLEHTKYERFLSAILSVEAILVGFSFSVMFFLLSENGHVDYDDKILEHKARSEKLSKLSKEIFYNVSYFNLMSIFSVFTALLLLLPNYELKSESYLYMLLQVTGFDMPINMKLQEAIGTISSVVIWLLWTCLYVFLAQSLCTLVRTIARVHFYFSEKIALRDSKHNPHREPLN